jgi:hypothetical protein
MKTEGQVRRKLQQVTYRHLQRAVRTALSRRPENCENNRRVKLPVLGSEVRFCTVIEDVDGDFVPCDERHGGLEQAEKCSQFACASTKDSVRDDFTKFLRDSDVATIAAEYPDLAALLWTLDDTAPVLVEEPEAPEPTEPPIPPYNIIYFTVGGAISLPAVGPFTGHRAVLYNVTFGAGS